MSSSTEGTRPLQNVCRFLELPMELRREIYAYALPCTTTVCSHGAENTVWLREKTALLRVSHQLHEECADILYGTNTFVIIVTYDRIEFLYRWLLPSGLSPKRFCHFLDDKYFPQRYIERIRHYAVYVEHVDSYMGMIKYNCGGRGLTAGVKSQVQGLVDRLKAVERLGTVQVRLVDTSMVLDQIRRVRVHCVEKKKDAAVTQAVLDPFLDLRAVRRAEVAGSVAPSYKEMVETAMMKTV